MGLVFEYMPCTLYSKIKDPIHRLSRSCIRSYMKMLLEGLHYMHNLGIMHRVSFFLNFCHTLSTFGTLSTRIRVFKYQSRVLGVNSVQC